MYDQLKNEKQAENFETIICTTFNGASCPGSKGWPVPSVAPDSWTGYRNVSDCSPLRCMQGEMTSLHCLRQKRKKVIRKGEKPTVLLHSVQSKTTARKQ